MPAKKARKAPATKAKKPVKSVKRLSGRGRSQQDRGSQAWKALFVAHFSEWANVKEACEAAGITTQTFYDSRKKDPAFAETVVQARLDVLGSVESAVLRRALGDSTADALAYLERYDPEWRKRKEVAGGTLRPVVFSPKLGTLAIVEDDGEDEDGS